MDKSHPLEFLVSALVDVTKSEEAVDKLVAVAVDTVGTSFGGITLIHDDGKRFETIGSTDASVVDADRLQYELREGPCVDASLTSESFSLSNLAEDVRWPTWGPLGQRAGLPQRSLLRDPRPRSPDRRAQPLRRHQDGVRQ